MELNLTAADVEQLVKNTIMLSGFGKAVEDGVRKALASGYDNPIDKEIKIYVGRVAGELIKEKFAAQIKESVAGYIEAKVTKQFLETVTSTAVDKMVAAADRY